MTTSRSLYALLFLLFADLSSGTSPTISRTLVSEARRNDPFLPYHCRGAGDIATTRTAFYPHRTSCSLLFKTTSRRRTMAATELAHLGDSMSWNDTYGGRTFFVVPDEVLFDRSTSSCADDVICAYEATTTTTNPRPKTTGMLENKRLSSTHAAAASTTNTLAHLGDLTWLVRGGAMMNHDDNEKNCNSHTLSLPRRPQQQRQQLLQRTTRRVNGSSSSYAGANLATPSSPHRELAKLLLLRGGGSFLSLFGHPEVFRWKLLTAVGTACIGLAVLVVFALQQFMTRSSNAGVGVLVVGTAVILVGAVLVSCFHHTWQRRRPVTVELELLTYPPSLLNKNTTKTRIT